MRTTIEIRDEQRARLLQLAARRKEKGFSKIVQEAIDQYLEGERAKADQIQTALALRGSFRGSRGQRLQELTNLARQSWR